MPLFHLYKSLILPFGKVHFGNTKSQGKIINTVWEAGLSNNKISSYKKDAPKAASEAGQEMRVFGQGKTGVQGKGGGVKQI